MTVSLVQCITLQLYSTLTLFEIGMQVTELIISLFLFSAFVGLLYPFLDQRLEEPLKYKGEWSNVMRCVAVFVGINHASAVSFYKQLTYIVHLINNG